MFTLDRPRGRCRLHLQLGRHCRARAFPRPPSTWGLGAGLFRGRCGHHDELVLLGQVLELRARLQQAGRYGRCWASHLRLLDGSARTARKRTFLFSMLQVGDVYECARAKKDQLMALSSRPQFRRRGDDQRGAGAGGEARWRQTDWRDRQWNWELADAGGAGRQRHDAIADRPHGSGSAAIACTIQSWPIRFPAGLCLRLSW